MVSKRKVQLEAGVDTTGAKKGFAEIKDSAKDMAQGVAQAGQQAAKGVESVGAGGDAAAAKLDRSTRSIIASIERATAATKAGGRGTAEYFEAVGAQKGTADTLKPYIEQLRQAERAQKGAQGTLDGMGMSAKATTAALRQVPAQFTDIITSLQGGQKPMTVLLQQGGQLKDVFGGAGPAARALGGYVLGLVNPFTLAAAAAGALAYAYDKGASEDQAFRRSVILTGGAAGATAKELAGMAAAINGAGGGTRGRAAEILNQMAQDSAVGAGNLQRFAAAAIDLEKVGGPAAEETAKAFSNLAKSPLEAALKLNEGTNFLTRSVYENIRALEQQGRSSEAAAVAQVAYFEAIEQRTPQLLQNLGYAERAWLAIKEAAKGAGDAVFGIGRETTDEEKLKALQSQLAARQERNSSIGIKDGKATLDLQAEINNISRRMLAQREAAGAQYVLNEQLKKTAEFDKEGLQYLTKQEQLRLAIKKATDDGAQAGKSQKEIQERVAAIREKFADKTMPKADINDRSSVDGIKRELGELTGAYANAEKILAAQRQAGAISEADYYAAKQAFIEADRDAQVRSLLAQNAELETLNKNTKLSAESRLSNNKAIADNVTKMVEVNNQAATSAEVLGIQQGAALAGVRKAYEEARQAAEDYLTVQRRGQERDLELFGASNRDRQTAQGRNQISDKYSQDRQRIANERALTSIQQGGSLTSDQQKRFDDLLTLNREFEDKALASYADYTDRRTALEGDWSQGAGRAFKNYIDDAADTAKQTEQLFSNAFSGIEDALVKFVTTGKLDFKSLADSIIADLVRIAIKQQVVAALKTAATFFGFANGGAFDASGEVKRFAAGGVFDQPTPFSYGNGNAGVLGEAGPEGVLPLARGAGGKLGVIAHDGGGSKGLQLNYAPVIQLDGTVDRAKALADAQQIMRQGQRELLDLLHAKGVY